jgi:hypothetical protein
MNVGILYWQQSIADTDYDEEIQGLCNFSCSHALISD